MTQARASRSWARQPAALAIAIALAVARPALADAPAFDRPGVGFASAVLPRGSFDWEQGLPDIERDSDAGMHVTSWTADSLFRFGLTSTLELQLSGSPWNRAKVSASGLRAHAEGAGDSAIGLKWAPPLGGKDWSFAVLGMASFATGSGAFSEGHTVTSFGAAATRDLGENRAVEIYANLDHEAGANTWTVSANFGFPIAGSLGGYVEAARIAGGGSSSSLAGAGLAWVLHGRVQLDLYADGGLSRRGPDYLAGFGVSVFWE